MGPVGEDKSFLAQSLSYADIMASYTARFLHADNFFRTMSQALVDNSVDRTFSSFLFPPWMTSTSTDSLASSRLSYLYRIIISCHWVSCFVITSNRAVEEWPSLLDEPILGNSALDRLANASCQIVIEGTSYGERLSTQLMPMAPKEAIDPALKPDHSLH